MRVFIIALCGIAVTAMLMFAGEKAPASPPMELKIAVAQPPMSGLIYIAYEEGFFKDEGLDVKLIPHGYGKQAAQDLIAGKVDVATAAETPFVGALRAGHGVAALATIESSDRQNLILARKDRGVERPRDLIGKRVGIVAGTSSEVFLDAFLITHMIPSSSVKRVVMTPDAIESSLEHGLVDAVSTWALPGRRISAALKSKSRSFVEDGLSVQNWFLLVQQSKRSINREAYVKLLRALLRAEEFEATHPSIAQKHVARHLGLDDRTLAQNWGRYYFNVGLHQYVLTNLETHIQLSPGGGPKQDINFTAAMFFSPLSEVDPDRVTVIH